PARRRTPPSFASSGWTWPGRTKSPATEAGSAIERTVRQRSSAGVPVLPERWAVGGRKAGAGGGGLGLRAWRSLMAGGKSGETGRAELAAATEDEVDRLRRGLFSRTDKIAFVFAVFGINDNDHLAAGE